ncbi:MAG: hypothetical protein RBR97_20560 [Bacteroidales bacterium]|nr:hypothetical protein [Bacteroidales bacterium]
MKNRNLLICIILLFGITTFFISCENEDSLINTPSTTQIEKSSSYHAYESFFIEIGQYHNSVLDYVAKNGDVSVLTREERFNLATKFTKSGNKWSEMEKLGDELLYIVENESSIVSILETPPFSKSALAYIDELNTCFDNAIYSARMGSPLKPSDFNKSIDIIINKIYENEKVIVDTTQCFYNEFAMVVAGCYLAKATFEYWYNSAIDTNGLWYGYLDLYASSKLPPWIKRAWHGVKVAAVDTYAWVTANGSYMDEDGYVHYTWNVPQANYYASEASGSVK